MYLLFKMKVVPKIQMQTNKFIWKIQHWMLYFNFSYIIMYVLFYANNIWYPNKYVAHKTKKICKTLCSQTVNFLKNSMPNNLLHHNLLCKDRIPSLFRTLLKIWYCMLTASIRRWLLKILRQAIIHI